MNPNDSVSIAMYAKALMEANVRWPNLIGAPELVIVTLSLLATRATLDTILRSAGIDEGIRTLCHHALLTSNAGLPEFAQYRCEGSGPAQLGEGPDLSALEF